MLLESLKYFQNLLGLEDAFLPTLVLILAFISAPICGYIKKGRTEITKDKKTDKILMDHYQFRE